MQALVCRLLQLSMQEKSIFHTWWGEVTSFKLPFHYRATVPPRTMLYRGQAGQEIRVVPVLTAQQEVQVQGRTVRYRLVTLRARGQDARRAFAEVLHTPGSDAVYFAANYDIRHDFHVNDWPEVQQQRRQ
jgi:hypothetical protein